MKHAVFLDRDGVINRAVIREGRPYPPASMDEFEFLPQVEEAIEKLHCANFLIFVVTNQPDVRTGVQRKEVVEAMHAHLASRCPVDDILVCYHVDEDGCECRKPQPGMLLQVAKRWPIDLSQSIMIGDRWRDIEAGKAAGCSTVLIRSEYAERQAENPDIIAESLFEASELILTTGML